MIFSNGQQSHGGDRKTFEVMTSVSPLGTFGSVTSLLAALYPTELKSKDITDRTMSVSYLDLHLEIDSEDRGIANHNDKRDDLNFPILNFHSYVVAYMLNPL
jgi:hypothetical protein